LFKYEIFIRKLIIAYQQTLYLYVDQNMQYACIALYYQHYEVLTR